MTRLSMTGTKALSLITAVSLVVLMSSMAIGAAASAKDEKKLTVGITMLNSDVKLPSGEKVLTKQLTDEFGVKQDKITSLKGKNLTYGDIAVVLAMADKMEGGITDTNISKIVSMKPSTSAGWSKVAQNLKIDLAEVADKVSTLEDSAHSGIKEAALETAGRGAGGGQLDSSGAGGAADETESGVTEEETMGGTGGASGEGTGGTYDSGDSPSSGSGGGY